MTSRLPRSVALLGYGGVLPFVIFALAPYIAPIPFALSDRILFNYGAVILSFVGALYWGFAMQTPVVESALRTKLYGLSVLPALIGWLAISIDCPALTAGLLIAGLLGQYWLDLRLTQVMSLPSWFLGLRTRLTLFACLSIALGGFL